MNNANGQFWDTIKDHLDTIIDAEKKSDDKQKSKKDKDV